jgi:hypothetical protein
MRKALICTAIYPARVDVVDDYISGVLSQSSSVELLLIAEKGVDVAYIDKCLKEHIEYQIIHADEGVRHIALRQLMLSAAKAQESDDIIFTDFDDKLCPDAVKLHQDILQNCDISYGDMHLMDDDSTLMGSCFFHGVDVPLSVSDPMALAERNFIGLSNSAVRRDCLKRIMKPIPHDITAVDWWLFTELLELGALAKKTKAPVLYYRNCASSTLGHYGIKTISALQKQLKIVINHYKYLRPTDERQMLVIRVQNSLDSIDQNKKLIEQFLSTIYMEPVVWFESVFKVCCFVSDRLNKPSKL